MLTASATCSCSRIAPGSTSRLSTTTIVAPSWRLRRARPASGRLRTHSRLGGSNISSLPVRSATRRCADRIGTSIACDLSVTRKLGHDPAANLVGIGVAAVAQDDDTNLPARHHPDIGGGIVEAAILLDGGRRVAVADLPGQRLRVARAHREYALLGQVHGYSEGGLDRHLAQIGRKKCGHVAYRGIPLAGARPVVVALLVAGLADRIAVLVIALNGSAFVFGREFTARRAIAAWQRRRSHVERAQDPARDQLVNGRPEPTLKRKLQQDESGVGVDVLSARLVIEVGRPFLQRAEELGQRVAPIRPRRMVLWQQ